MIARIVHPIETTFNIVLPVLPIFLVLMLVTNPDLNPQEKQRIQDQKDKEKGGSGETPRMKRNVPSMFPKYKTNVELKFRLKSNYTVHLITDLQSGNIRANPDVMLTEYIAQKYRFEVNLIEEIYEFNDWALTWNSTTSERHMSLEYYRTDRTMIEPQFIYASNSTADFNYMNSMGGVMGGATKFFVDAYTISHLEFWNLYLYAIACENKYEERFCRDLDQHALTYNWFPVRNSTSDRLISDTGDNKQATEYVHDYTYYNAEMINLLAMVFSIGFAIVLPIILRLIVCDKETRVREFYRMVGVSELTYWGSMFIVDVIIVLLNCMLVWYVLMSNTPFNQTSFTGRIDTTVFVIFFTLSGAQFILFCFLLSTFFSSTIYAGYSSIIIFITITGVTIYETCPFMGKYKSPSLILFSVLFPPGSMYHWFALQNLLGYNDIDWNWESLDQEFVFPGVSHMKILYVIVISMPIYVVLTLYMDAVWPYQHGIPKHPLFFIKEGIFEKTKKTRIKHLKAPKLDRKRFEIDANKTEAKIRLINATKCFVKTTGKFVAVNKIWMSIYENQLTVLLGHNGAGKSTCMNMITAMYDTTEGEIFVNGFNVRTQTRLARQSIGLCPQDNFYINDLTVGEHFQFFALLKGYKRSLIKDEVTELLDMLNLNNERNTFADTLSGGMKRKLALGIAMIGQTNILILDEPTSGMDPEVRRSIWDLLISIRRSRTILLTTHYLEEADILGDKIIIMSEGKIACSGSPAFLKSNLGTGYTLRISKFWRFNAQSFLLILRQHLPNCEIVSEIGTEVIYSFKISGEARDAIMPAMFTYMEENREQLGIEAFGLSFTSLEDVFLNIGSDMDLAENAKLTNNKLKFTTADKMLEGWNLLQNQVRCILIKRSLCAMRQKSFFIFQILIPSFIIGLGVIMANLMTQTELHHVIHLQNDLDKIVPRERNIFFAGNNVLNKHISDISTTTFGMTFYHSTMKKVRDIIYKQYNTTNFFFGYFYDDRNKRYHVYVNESRKHSVLYAMSVFFKAVSKMNANRDFSDSYGVTINFDNESVMEVMVAWFVYCLIFNALAFPFLGASYIVLPVKEKANRSKLIQYMSGLKPLNYWLCNFAFDMLLHLLATILMIIFIFFLDYQHVVLKNYSTILAMFALIFSYGFSTIPFTYLFSFCFDDSSKAFMCILLINIFVAILVNLGVSIIYFISVTQVFLLYGFFDTILSIMFVFPLFNLLYGLQKLFVLNFLMTRIIKNDMKIYCELMNFATSGIGLDTNPRSMYCRKFCGEDRHFPCLENSHPLANDIFGAFPEIKALFLSGILYFILVIAVEQNYFYFVHLYEKFLLTSKATLIVDSEPDSDVVEEEEKIRRQIESKKFEDLLTVYRLEKYFGSFHAVKGLSFSVKEEECFGLLGVNGAGKTTTFSMLTGELEPTFGNAYLRNGEFSLRNDLRIFQQMIGYCPQFDPLVEFLTGEEILMFYGRLRGVPENRIKDEVRNIVLMVGLEAHYKNLATEYSGGNKRKLSTAMTLIGIPQLIFLDEPSAGVDPAARRKIWQMLQFIRKSLKCSIVFTSHSMEECEALCSRIVIMVSGEFRCMGSLQHLRDKYGQGYNIIIRLDKMMSADDEYCFNLQEDLESLIPSAVMLDFHQGLMQYHVQDNTQQWSYMFSVLAFLNKKYAFEDYTVCDTTLEQIFINFAREKSNTTDSQIGGDADDKVHKDGNGKVSLRKSSIFKSTIKKKRRRKKTLKKRTKWSTMSKRSSIVSQTPT